MTLVDELRNELSRHEGVRLALLFGSRATGRFTASSDVDVAVDAPGVDTLGLAAALSQALGLEVDVLDLREAGYPILKRILHEGWWSSSATAGLQPAGGPSPFAGSRPTGRGSSGCAMHTSRG